MKASPVISDETAFDLSPDEAQLLLRLAFIAIGRHYYVSADRLLSCLEHFRPNAEALLAARAVTHLAKCDFTLCRDTLAARPDALAASSILRLFCAIAHLRLGETAAAHALLIPLLRDPDPKIAAFAQDLLP